MGPGAGMVAVPVPGEGYGPLCLLWTDASAVPRGEGGREIRQFVNSAESDQMEAKLSLSSILEGSQSVLVSFPGAGIYELEDNRNPAQDPILAVALWLRSGAL